MISRIKRFHGHSSLRFVYQRGQTVRGPALAIRYHANPKRTHYRAAVVVSKKVSKKAVVRNRIRRRVYEIIRLHEADILQPYDIVVTIFSETVATMPPAQLESSLTKLLHQAGIVARRITTNTSPKE